jgi:hypothetical protein
VTQALVAGRLDHGVAVLHLDLNSGLSVAHMWGENLDALLRGAFYQRIRPHLPDGVEVGLAAPNRAVVVGPIHTAPALDGVAATIRREIAPRPITLPGMSARRLSVTTRRFDYDSAPSLADLLQAPIASPDVMGTPLAGIGDAGERRLFDMADRLMTSRKEVQRKAEARVRS